MIEASFAKQYGIRIRNQPDISWDEFCTLLAGLMPDTPLGHVVSIRSEKDQKVIKSFTPEQKRIYSDWMRKQASKKLENPRQLEEDMKALTNMIAAVFGGSAGEVKK